jgi:fluoride exporter
LLTGDGVRLKRSGAIAGTDDSWLPRGARSFCFFALILLRARDRQRIGVPLRLILIAVFGAIGTLARYGLQGVVQIRTGGTFPYGTLLINLTGCFLLALIYQLTLNRLIISPDWRFAIGVGFFGGFTTFSSFGWETAKMLEDGEWLAATAYVAASVIVGLLLSVTGIRLANRF